MRKTVFLPALCLLLILSGCQRYPLADGTSPGAAQDAAPAQSAPDDGAQPASSQADGVVEIKEKMFIAQLNDIYLNQDDYLGKTIRYEGMFTQYHWDDTDMTYYMVYRQSPGCCGADGQAGFEVVWPEGADSTYPSENDWCQVVGTLEAYDEAGQSYLHIVLDSLTVLQERGAEFVSQ